MVALHKKGNTVVTNDDKGILVRLYNTTIVKVDNDTNSITLDTGGYNTKTTKDRMNLTSDTFNLGFRVYQKDFTWYVSYKGKEMMFEGHDVTFII